MQGGAPYLRPSGCLSLAAADAVLVLDDGTQLPAHSAVLALHCSVIDMLLADRQQLAGAPGAAAAIPLPQETRSAATAFLRLLYCPSLTARGWAADNTEGLQPEELDAAERLADKLGAGELVALCRAVRRGWWQAGWQGAPASGCGSLYARRALAGAGAAPVREQRGAAPSAGVKTQAAAARMFF
jgi:hypothetical protein